jgi:glycosyltransferase involved in cell wall biosynthesis
MPPKVLVTITVFNEQNNIETVLRKIPAEHDVLVVDDGSTDRTVEIAKRLGAKVAIHPVNLMQGPAVITSFKIGLMEDYDILIEMDGDGQHDPKDIPRFVEVLDNSGYDVVVGSRVLGKDYKTAPFLRRTVLPHLTSLINRITDYELTDSMCGFRAFRTNSLRRVIKELENMFEPQYLAAEMFIRFAHAGLTVTEIPIELKERTSGRSRKGTLRYGWGVGRAILKTFLEKKVVTRAP